MILTRLIIKKGPLCAIRASNIFQKWLVLPYEKIEENVNCAHWARLKAVFTLSRAVE